MKLALGFSTPDVTKPLPLALLTGSFVQRLEKARDLGYDGVELMVVNPSELDPASIRTHLLELGLEAAAVATGGILLQEGMALLSDSISRSRLAAARLHELIDFAAALGSPVVTVGSFRGRRAWAGHDTALHLLMDALLTAADRAYSQGVRIAVEPLNRYETDIIHNAAEGLEWLAEAHHDGLGLLLDTFHMNIEEVDMAAALRQVHAAGKLLHVHLGDSNRLPPGQGHIDFPTIIRTLQEIGYQGCLSAELLPLPDPDTAAQQTIHHIRPLLRS